ncbi:hypothetical protein NDU88_000412 [Pleurodeles waltl]|uniref:Uncharacterized protein n=1 Tax=Pleurodeles waltl TaxID=8319 RepID=A0AAV7LWE4_PLEWA|nr:hypothetical protein NDU88_000412 [Pleurodeles waltl]
MPPNKVGLNWRSSVYPAPGAVMHLLVFLLLLITWSSVSPVKSCTVPPPLPLLIPPAPQPRTASVAPGGRERLTPLPFLTDSPELPTSPLGARARCLHSRKHVRVERPIIPPDVTAALRDWLRCFQRSNRRSPSGGTVPARPLTPPTIRAAVGLAVT